MAALSSVTIDAEGKNLEIKLCGRKGFRYLEVYFKTAPWRKGVSDDITLDNVEFKSYKLDGRGDFVDTVVLTINEEKYYISQSKTYGGYSYDNKDEFVQTSENMQLGYLFDEIKDKLGCDSDNETKEKILENARLLNILKDTGVVDLAKQIDSLKQDNELQIDVIVQLKKELGQTKSLLDSISKEYQGSLDKIHKYETD